MVFLFLAIVIACNTVKGYCGKCISGSIRGTEDAFVYNGLRMLLCAFIGLALVFFEGSGEMLRPDFGMLAICILSGVSNAAFLVFWLFAVRYNSMVSVDVGLTLGSLIPSVLCLILFGDPFSLPKMIGFALIMAATVILAGKVRTDIGYKSVGIILLCLAAIGDGMTGFSQQLYKHYYTDAGSRAGELLYPKTVYHFYTYLFAVLTFAAVIIGYRIFAHRARENEKNEARSQVGGAISARVAVHILIMAVCLFAANYFQTVAANDYGFSSQLLYPIVKGGCLITVNFVAMIFFGEPITKRNILGSLTALAGIIAMSII